jgi:hypothetical protein
MAMTTPAAASFGGGGEGESGEAKEGGKQEALHN